MDPAPRGVRTGGRGLTPRQARGWEAPRAPRGSFRGHRPRSAQPRCRVRGWASRTEASLWGGAARGVSRSRRPPTASAEVSRSLPGVPACKAPAGPHPLPGPGCGPRGVTRPRGGLSQGGGHLCVLSEPRAERWLGGGGSERRGQGRPHSQAPRSGQTPPDVPLSRWERNGVGGGGRGSHGSGPGSARPWDLLFLGGPRHKGRGPGGQARTGVLDTRVWVPGARQTLEPGGVCCHSAHSTECADHCQQEAQCPWTPPTLHPSSGPFPGPPQPGPDGRVGPPRVVAVRSCCCLGSPVRPRAVGAVPVTACPVLGGAPGSAEGSWAGPTGGWAHAPSPGPGTRDGGWMWPGSWVGQ